MAFLWPDPKDIIGKPRTINTKLKSGGDLWADPKTIIGAPESKYQSNLKPEVRERLERIQKQEQDEYAAEMSKPWRKVANNKIFQGASNVSEKVLGAGDKALGFAFNAVKEGSKAVEKGLQYPAQLVAGKGWKEAYTEAPTIGQMTGDLVRPLVQNAEQRLIQNHGQGFGDSLVASLPETTEQVLDNIIIPAVVSYKIGSEVLKPKTQSIKATPEQITDALNNNKAMDPRARMVLEELQKKGQGLEVTRGKPVGVVREIVGKYFFGGKEEKPAGTYIKGTGEPVGRLPGTEIAPSGSQVPSTYVRGSQAGGVPVGAAVGGKPSLREQFGVDAKSPIQSEGNSPVSAKPTLRQQMGTPEISDPTGLRDQLQTNTGGEVQYRPATQLRNLEMSDGYDRERVDYYKDRIAQGDQIEPVIVTREADGSLAIEDGKHRVLAHIESGVDQIPTVMKSRKAPSNKPNRVTQKEMVELEKNSRKFQSPEMEQNFNQFARSIRAMKRDVPEDVAQYKKQFPNRGDLFYSQDMTDSEVYDLFLDRVNAGRSSGIYASKGSQPIGTFEKTAPKAGTAEFKLFNQVEEFIHKYAKRIGEGYLPRGARGVYYPQSNNIRLSGMNDVSVAAHETTHYVDSKLGIAKKILAEEKVTGTVRKALKEVYMKYYPTAKKSHKLELKMVEGIATMLQKYAEQPTTFKQQFPELVSAFFEKGGKYYQPVFKDMIEDLRSMIENYQGLSSLDKIGARVTSENYKYDKPSFLTLSDKIRTEMADSIYPLEVLSQKAGTNMTDADVSIFARMYNNINAPVMNNINGKRGYWMWKDGKFTKVHDFNWRNLVENLEKDKVSDSFGYYLVARRVHFEYEDLAKLEGYEKELSTGILAETNPKTKIMLQTALQEVSEQKKKLTEILKNDGILKEEADAAYDENKTRFKSHEDMFDKLTAGDLDFLHDKDVQLVNNEDYARLGSLDGYASFKREFYDEIVGGEDSPSVVTKVGKGKVSSLLQRKGSQRAIVNPVYSGIRNHVEMMQKGFAQIVRNKMLPMSKQFPELFQQQQLQAVPDGKGRMLFPQEKDPNIIIARQNFKRVPILVDKIVKRTLDDVLNYKNITYFEKIVQGASRFFTKSTTGTFAPFMVANYPVDQIAASAQSMNKYAPVYDNLKELWSVVSRDTKSLSSKYYQEYMVLGGERQTIVGWQDMSPSELFEKIAGERKGILKAIDAANKGVDILAAPSKYSEIVTRATEYIKARKAGKPQLVALEQAGRVSAPFHHSGRLLGSSALQLWLRSVPFVNPGIQVVDQALRSALNKTGAKRYFFVWAAVTAAMVGSLMLLTKTATKKQKQQYRDLDPSILASYLILPQPDGDGLIRIRIPQQLSFTGALINMGIADQMMDEGVDYSFGDYVDASTSWLPEQFNPTDIGRAMLSSIPQIAKPGLLFYLGVKDFPNVMPLENLSLKNLPTKFRSTETSTPVAKWLSEIGLGDHLDLSPIEIDYLITGYAGRTSGFFTGKPGVYNPLQQATLDYYFTNGRTLQHYYEIKQQVTEETTADKKGLEKRGELWDERRVKVKQIDKYLEIYKKTEDPQVKEQYRNMILESAQKLK